MVIRMVSLWKKKAFGLWTVLAVLLVSSGFVDGGHHKRKNRENKYRQESEDYYEEYIRKYYKSSDDDDDVDEPLNEDDRDKVFRFYRCCFQANSTYPTNCTNNSCYFVLDDTKTWQGARYACEGTLGGSDLLTAPADDLVKDLANKTLHMRSIDSEDTILMWLGNANETRFSGAKDKGRAYSVSGDVDERWFEERKLEKRFDGREYLQAEITNGELKYAWVQNGESLAACNFTLSYTLFQKCFVKKDEELKCFRTEPLTTDSTAPTYTTPFTWTPSDEDTTSSIYTPTAINSSPTEDISQSPSTAELTTGTFSTTDYNTEDNYYSDHTSESSTSQPPATTTSETILASTLNASDPTTTLSSSDPTTTLSSSDSIPTTEYSESTTFSTAQDSSSPLEETTPLATTELPPCVIELENDTKICGEQLEYLTNKTVNCTSDVKGNITCYCHANGSYTIEKNCEGGGTSWIDVIADMIRNGTRADYITRQLSDDLEKGRVNDLESVEKVLNLFPNLTVLAKNQFNIKNRTQLQDFMNTGVSSLSKLFTREDTKNVWRSLPSHKQVEFSSLVVSNTEQVASLYSIANTEKVDSGSIDLMPFFDISKDTEYISSSKSDSINIHWPQKNASATFAVGTTFRDLGQYMVLGEGLTEGKGVNSKVLGLGYFSTDGVNFPVNENIKVSVRLTHVNSTPKAACKSGVCVFWNFSKRDWDNSNCRLKQCSRYYTECECDHLTNFAVLFDSSGKLGQDKVLNNLSMVCSILSIITLIMTIGCLTSIRSLRCRKSTITSNVCFSLLLVNLLLLIMRNGDNDGLPEGLCKAIRSVLMFSLLSSFTWMLLEGFHLYRMIVLVFNHTHIRTVWFYSTGYGLPLLYTAVVTGVTFNDDKREDRQCWFAGWDILYVCVPLAVIIIVNSIILVMSFVSASRVKIKTQQGSREKFMSWLKGSASLVCLLGINWIVGLPLLSSEDMPYIAYPFVVINALQGVQIFIFHVIWNENARTILIRMFKSKFTETQHRMHSKGSSQHRLHESGPTNSFRSSTKSNQSSTKSTRAGSSISSRSSLSRDMAF